MATTRFLADGSVDEGTRHTCSAEDVVRAWIASTSIIPAYVAVGMAERESSFTLNEEDTEDSGYVSTGIFQLGDDTRRQAVKRGLVSATWADFTKLDDSCKVLSCTLEENLQAILVAAVDAFSRGLGKNPTDENGQPIPDVWAYVAVSHNIGLGSKSNDNAGGAGVLPGIVHYGLSWPDAFVTAHPSMQDRQVRYGNTAMSGGAQWTTDLAALLPSPVAGLAAKVERGSVLLLLLALAGLVVAVGWRWVSTVA